MRQFQLFISYRRKSWAFAHRLVDELGKRLDAKIFIDLTGIDEPDFEKSILGNLRNSDAVLLIVTEYTFLPDRIQQPEDWIRREINEALKLSKPIVLVSVDGHLPPSDLPDDIRDITRYEAIKFYPEFFIPAVERLTDFINRTTLIPLQKEHSEAPPMREERFAEANLEFNEIVYHRHVTALIEKGFVPFLLLVATFIGWTRLDTVVSLQWVWIGAAIFLSILTLVSITALYMAYYDWRYFYLIINKDTLKYIHKRPLWLQNTIWAARLSMVETVTLEQEGLLDAIFNRGTVHIFLAGQESPHWDLNSHENSHAIDKIGTPTTVQNEISQRIVWHKRTENAPYHRAADYLNEKRDQLDRVIRKVVDENDSDTP